MNYFFCMETKSDYKGYPHLERNENGNITLQIGLQDTPLNGEEIVETRNHFGLHNMFTNSLLPFFSQNRITTMIPEEKGQANKSEGHPLSTVTVGKETYSQGRNVMQHLSATTKTETFNQ